MTRGELKASRQRLRLTQAQLAAELGVRKPIVSLWERGVQPIPRRTDLAVRYLVLMAAERASGAPQGRIDGQGRVWHG